VSEFLRIIADRIAGVDPVKRQLLEYINRGLKTKEKSKLAGMPASKINLTTLGRQVPGNAPDWAKGLSQDLDRGVVKAALNQRGVGAKMGGSVTGDPASVQEPKIQGIVFSSISSERLRRAEDSNIPTIRRYIKGLDREGKARV
jgi:hypothetical protein